MAEHQRTEELAAEFLDDESASPRPDPADRAQSGDPADPSDLDDVIVTGDPLPADQQDGRHGELVRHARTAPDPLADPPSGSGTLARLLGLALAVAIGIAGGLLILTYVLGKSVSALNPFHETTVDRSGPAVLVRLNDLHQFHAASGYYEIVIDQAKDVSNLPDFIAGDRVIFVAAGTVDASVDFSGLGSGAVTVNDAHTAATIRLPAPTLGQPKLDLQRSYVADHQRGLVQRLQDAVSNTKSDTDTTALYRLAQTKLGEAGSRSDDLTVRAKQNTRAMLTSLLGSLGYTSVTVTFADDR